MKVLCITAAAIAAFAAAPVLADDENAPKLSVTYGASDLATAQAAAALLERIEDDAQRVCAVEGRALTLRRSQLTRECADELVAKAVAAINADALTAAFGGSDNGGGFAAG